jgi:hypothetical protein
MPIVREPVQKPRLFYLVVFFSFFFGMLSFMDSVTFFTLYFSPQQSEIIHQLLEGTIFTKPQILGLSTYQLLCSLGILWTTWLLLAKHSEFGRKALKTLYIIDVFLFVAILFYYYQLQYKPPDPDAFYYSVASTLFEILLIICISHPSMIQLTQTTPGENSSGSDENKN